MMRAVLVSLSALALAACQTSTTNHYYSAESGTDAPSSGLDAEAPDTMQWLYGSGEAAANSIQAWRHLADYAISVSRNRMARQSVSMGIGGEVADPQSCQTPSGTKPLAVVFDVDETVLLNLGYEYWVAATGNSYSRETWKLWEESGATYVKPVPGAVTGLRRLREAGITPVFNTNRQYSPEGAARAIAAAGLGEAVHRDTLYLRGDDGTTSGDKDGRRALIAERYCVIALAGDNLGDFADIFNDDELPAAERRELAARGDLAQLWGNGWFVLPNPVYGDSLKGTVGEVYPEGTRWSPETASSAAPAIMNEGN